MARDQRRQDGAALSCPLASDLSPPPPNLQPPTSNLQPRTSNLEPPTSNLRPLFPVTNRGWRVTNRITTAQAADARLDRQHGRADSACMPASRMPVRLPLLFGIATAFGLSSTVQSYLLSVSTGRKPDGMIGHLLLLNLAYWFVPAIL